MEQKHTCPQCETKRKEEEASDEFSFAVLLSLIPMLVFTFFGQAGLL